MGNASTKSHAELGEAEQLDDGNPIELGQQYQSITASCEQINIYGGCCGIDHRHIYTICREVIL